MKREENKKRSNETGDTPAFASESYSGNDEDNSGQDDEDDAATCSTWRPLWHLSKVAGLMFSEGIRLCE